MNALAIIQARVGASRLPNKTMALIEDAPLLAHVIRRVKASNVDSIVVATPDTAENDCIAALAECEGVGVYRGSEQDVLGRMYWAAEQYPHHDPVVRICGEDFAKDYRLINYALLAYEVGWTQGDDPHYLHLGGITWPLGCDVEVFSRHALTEAYKNASKPEHREHVTPWMADAFAVWQLRNPTPRKGYDINKRWTVDTAEDLEYARAVYARLYKTDPLFGYPEIVEAGL